MKDNGKIILFKVKENYFTKMVIIMKVNGLIVKSLDKVFIYIMMDPNIMDNGKMMKKLVEVDIFTLMEIFTMVI